MFALHPAETIILVTRKHWFLVFERLLLIAFLSLIPFLIAGALPFLSHNVSVDISPATPFIIFALAIYGMVLLAAFFFFFVDYYLDMWVVTGIRIIDVEQHGLFSRTVSEIPLERVQDVTTETHGIIRTLLGFGTIRIQTAGEREFLIHDVPNPERVKEIILHEAKQQNKNSNIKMQNDNAK